MAFNSYLESRLIILESTNAPSQMIRLVEAWIDMLLSPVWMKPVNYDPKFVYFYKQFMFMCFMADRMNRLRTMNKR